MYVCIIRHVLLHLEIASLLLLEDKSTQVSAYGHEPVMARQSRNKGLAQGMETPSPALQSLVLPGSALCRGQAWKSVLSSMLPLAAGPQGHMEHLGMDSTAKCRKANPGQYTCNPLSEEVSEGG